MSEMGTYYANNVFPKLAVAASAQNEDHMYVVCHESPDDIEFVARWLRRIAGYWQYGGETS
jgi:hypothetical protein